MSWDEFLRKNLTDFFIVVTCVTLLMSIFGLIYEPNQRFGYEAYFSPLIFGVIGVLPSFITYSKKELTIRQMMIRKALQLVVLEGLILSFGYWIGAMKGSMMVPMAGSVFFVFLLVHIISYVIDSKQAAHLSQELKAFQEKS